MHALHNQYAWGASETEGSAIQRLVESQKPIGNGMKESAKLLRTRRLGRARLENPRMGFIVSESATQWEALWSPNLNDKHDFGSCVARSLAEPYCSYIKAL